MMLLDYLIILMAVPLGLVSGLLPSIGSTVSIMLLYVFLQQMSPDVILAFYIVFLSASQFSGSVSALWLGVMGEPTSLPIIRERPLIITDVRAMTTALYRTAQASVIAGLLALTLMFLMIKFGGLATWTLRTEALIVILGSVLIGAVFWKNPWWLNVLLISMGAVLSLVGYNDVAHTTFIDIPVLLSGIPHEPFLLGLYALPLLLTVSHTLSQANKDFKVDFNDPVSSRWIGFGPTIRGTLVGMVSGLIPWLGTVLSSNAAHFLENKLHPAQNIDHSLKRCTAAEASNNAAFVSMIFPLLIFGIAIQPHEAIILGILWDKNWTVSSVTDHTYILMAGSLIVACLLSYIACTKFSRHISEIAQRNSWYMVLIPCALVSVSMLWLGYQQGIMMLYFVTLVLSTGIGYVIIKRGVDVLPLITGFLIFPALESALTRFYQLYF